MKGNYKVIIKKKKYVGGDSKSVIIGRNPSDDWENSEPTVFRLASSDALPPSLMRRVRARPFNTGHVTLGLFHILKVRLDLQP